MRKIALLAFCLAVYSPAVEAVSMLDPAQSVLFDKIDWDFMEELWKEAARVYEIPAGKMPRIRYIDRDADVYAATDGKTFVGFFRPSLNLCLATNDKKCGAYFYYVAAHELIHVLFKRADVDAHHCGMAKDIRYAVFLRVIDEKFGDQGRALAWELRSVKDSCAKAWNASSS